MFDDELSRWQSGLRDGLRIFLSGMLASDFASCKYSWSGDLRSPSGRWGAGSLVFAIKTLYMSGILDELDDEKRGNLAGGILKFADRKGYIYDPWVTQRTFVESFKEVFGRSDPAQLEWFEQVKRAETRQAFAALFLLDERPRKAFLHLPQTQDAVDSFLEGLDWSHPWGAGSHFSHLLFFLHMNRRFFGDQFPESETLVQKAVAWVNRLQSSDDGCWYATSAVSLQEKINGAMKILTGLHAAEIVNFQHVEKLIDTCLLAVNDAEASSNLNIVYVLYACSLVDSSYRREEVRNFLLERLRLYKEFYRPDQGGFSFHRDRANDVYYGKKITRGLDEADIHGTTLFVWGVALVEKILGEGPGFRVPVT